MQKACWVDRLNLDGRHFSRLIIVLILIVLFLNLATRGWCLKYSYSADELYSVATSNASWPEMFEKWIIPDTHPPLYPVLLKIWIMINGSSEPATRSLSVLISTLTLLSAACLLYTSPSPRD